MTFAGRKFRKLLLASTFTVLANYLIRLIDSVFAGQFVGADALAGVNLAAPVMSAIAFAGGLVATGSSTVCSIAAGKCDRQRVRELFTQGVWTALGFGTVLAMAVFFGREALLGFFDASAEIEAHARGYLAGIWPLAPVECVMTLMIALGYADGDARRCVAAYVTAFALNLAVTFAAVRLGFGTFGCAVGSVFSELAAVAVMLRHFFLPANTFVPVRHFSLRDALRIVGASFGDAAAFLCEAVLFAFLDKFAIVRFGSEILPVVGVATVLWGMTVVFDGIGVAVQPFVTVYYGEGDYKSVRALMNRAVVVSCAAGLAFTAVLMAFPQIVVRIVGVSEGDVAIAAERAVRILCLAAMPRAVASLFNSYYMFVERPLQAGVITGLCYLALPALGAVLGASSGANGMWLGFAIGPALGLACAALAEGAFSGWATFPYLLTRARDAGLFTFDLELEPQAIVAASHRVGDVLRQYGAGTSAAVRAMMMVEEVFLAVRDRAPGRRLTGQVTVDLNAPLSGGTFSLTLRDDGEVFDITDADQRISSLRSYLVASLMERQAERINLVTTGFNRNVFRF